MVISVVIGDLLELLCKVDPLENPTSSRRARKNTNGPHSKTQCILKAPPRGSGSRSGLVESCTTSCISRTFACGNASFGNVPDCECPLTNSSDRIQLRKS